MEPKTYCAVSFAPGRHGHQHSKTVFDYRHGKDAHPEANPHELSIAELKRYNAIFFGEREPDSLAALAGITLVILFGVLVTVYGE